MAEWAILLVLVPAVVIPVVLLVGFAGCFTKPDRPNPFPFIVRAEGSSRSTIALEWTFVDPSSATFEIEPTKQGGNPPLPVIGAPASPADVPNLDEGSTYDVRVRAVYGDGDTSPWSPVVSGATLSVTFDTAADVGPAGDQPAMGFCVVQRIEQVRLDTSGTRVRIVLRGPAAGATSIDRIYVSRPTAAGDPYDSAADLTAVFDIGNPAGQSPIVIQPNAELALPVIDYALDEAQPLLIAFDLTPLFPTSIRFVPVPQDVVAFFQAGVAEAGIIGGNRTAGYSVANGVGLVTRIEVG